MNTTPAYTEDTIVAAATPPGKGGIGVVRISGPDTAKIATQMLGDLPAPRYATVAEFRGADGTPIDAGLALYFPTPDSFTGETVLELQGHGGPLVMSLLVDAAVALGVQLAIVIPGHIVGRIKSANVNVDETGQLTREAESQPVDR